MAGSAPPPPLILASASPRRSELLAQMGLEFRIQPSSIEEVYLPEFSPEENAERLALQKCLEISGRFPDSFVLGADTLVFLEDKVLGKPGNREEAVEMLSLLSGKRHKVVTGVALLNRLRETCLRGALSSFVSFRLLSPAEIRAYVEGGEPMDKAGAYAIQGGAAGFVTGTEGSYTNIIGLPLRLVIRFLIEAGLENFSFKEPG